MSLKFTTGKAGEITYLGRRVTVWKYDSLEDLKAEFDNLGYYLNGDSMAWIDNEVLVYGCKVVGRTTPMGIITWYNESVDLPVKYQPVTKAEAPMRQVGVRGKRREAPIIEDSADIDIKELWKSATRIDWEAIMVKTSW